MNEMRVPAVRTGYEAILPYRMSDKFCVMAEEDGVVDSVSKSNVKVTYKSGKKKAIKLGTWTGKEESGVSYEHTLITDLSKGTKFKKGNTISYDSQFFEPDIFDPTRVIYKTGTFLKVALMETTETYEDSCVISRKVAKRMGTKITKSKSFIVKSEDEIVNLVNVGDMLEPNDLLFTITDSNMVKDADGRFDKEAISVLQNIKNKSPKAKMRGKVTGIKIFYNDEVSNLSRTLKKIIKESDEKLLKTDNATGKVNGSYSIKGKSLVEGNVEIKVYINDEVDMGIGDKTVVSNQLKATIGDIYDYNMKTEDGTEIEANFSTQSIANRIVLSSSIIGTTTTVLNLLRDTVVDDYFN